MHKHQYILAFLLFSLTLLLVVTQGSENIQKLFGTSQKKRQEAGKKQPQASGYTFLPIAIAMLVIAAVLYLGYAFLEGSQNEDNTSPQAGAAHQPTVVFSTTNQFREGGPAACLHAASTAISFHLQNPEAPLYDAALLDQFCATGAQNHPGREADEYSNIFNQSQNKARYGLRVVKTINYNRDKAQPNFIPSQQAMEQDINSAEGYGCKTGIIRNSGEAWALFLHDDGTLSIFDSHGKMDEHGNAYAYICWFQNPGELWAFIVQHNAFLRGEVVSEGETALQRRHQEELLGFSIYWVKPSRRS